MKTKKQSLGSSIIQGLEEILEYKEGKIDLRTTSIKMPKPPAEISGVELKKIREKKLKMSQSVLAKYLGVSAETVRAWEQEKSTPSGPALRMINVAKKDSESFFRMVLNF